MSGFPAPGTGAAGAMNGAQAIGRRRATGTDGFPTVGNGAETVGGNTADTGRRTEPTRAYLFTSLPALEWTACAVVATTVTVGETVVETTVDVAAAEINTVVGSSDERKQ